MSTKRILGLGTYPVVKPVHGGQRRVAEIRSYYASLGIEFLYACIYSPAIYRSPDISVLDFPLKAPPLDLESVPFLDDVNAGTQAGRDPATLRHFLGLVERYNPDALQLEQPFMWPLAKQLQNSFGERHLPIIYSSQNVEAPLKRAILGASQAHSEAGRRVCDEIERDEEICVGEAKFIICVSASDRAYYLKLKPTADVVLIPNGTARPPLDGFDDGAVHAAFGQSRFLFTVGSAYPPNIEGFCNLVAEDGIFNFPPVKSIAVCGAMADGIYNHPNYHKYATSNSTRVHFFSPIEDRELWSLKRNCHGVFLPLQSGGGTNLKTAEALVLGKWTVATSTALRGYEKFRDAEGVIEVKDRRAFRHAMREVLNSPALDISDSSKALRESLYWDRCFSDSPLAERLRAL